MKTRTTSTDGQIRGRKLLLARVVWLAFAIFNLILFGINLLQPLFGGQTIICPFSFTCPYDTSTLLALQHAHISLTAYTSYVTGFGFLYALVFVGLSMFLFWRMFDQLTGLLASFSFLLLGLGGLAGDLSSVPLALQVFYDVIQTLCLFFCLGFFLVTFPDGRFIPRWSWLIGFTLFVQAIFFMIPGRFNILSWPTPLFLFELAIAYGSPVAIQIYRFRRVYSPAQRQQTKWVMFGLACTFLLNLLANLAGDLVPIFNAPGSFYYLVSASLTSLAFLLIPLSVTIAILHSRLWDIDVIIRRTLVYSTLTVILALLYFGLVIGLESLLRPLAEQGGQSQVIIVVSTLVIAVLFQPLRHRIQGIIDRRFYRRKYNAAKIVEAFSATLRNEVDLSLLREHLITVVQIQCSPHMSRYGCANQTRREHPFLIASRPGNFPRNEFSPCLEAKKCLSSPISKLLCCNR